MNTIKYTLTLSSCYNIYRAIIRKKRKNAGAILVWLL